MTISRILKASVTLPVLALLMLSGCGGGGGGTAMMQPGTGTGMQPGTGTGMQPAPMEPARSAPSLASLYSSEPERSYSDANHSAITVFIDLAVEDSSSKRLTETFGLEGDLLARFGELVLDLEPGKVSTLDLRLASQQLRDAGYPTFQPDIVE